MFETLAQMILGDHLNGEAYVPPIAETGYGRLLNPYRRPFKTLDGHLALTPYNDKQFRAFFSAIGREAEFDGDSRINTHAARARNYDAAYSLLADIVATRSTDEWLALCEAHEIPSQRINSIDDLLGDRHLNQAGFFQEVDHPTEGRIRQMRHAARWSSADLSTRCLPPRIGEHSVEVLHESGFSSSEIESLLACGATVQAATESGSTHKATTTT